MGTSIRSAVIAAAAWGWGVTAISAVAVTACAAAAESSAQLAEERSFEIDAQPLGLALKAFAGQTGMQIMFAPEMVEGRMAPAVQGRRSGAQALRQLLAGSGLNFVVEGTTIAVRSTTEAAVATFEANESRLAQAGDAAASAAGAAGSTAAEKQVEEIVVTAQKREEKLQDVPISISVLSGKALDRSSFASTVDALRTLPGVNVSTAGDQYNNGVTIGVRGVSNASARNGGASPVAYYLDGVPYGFVRSAFLPGGTNVFDLRQMEVLSGPQGTLYGANALNGVVRVMTQDAEIDKTEFKARTSVSSTEGGGDGYGADVAVNVPIVEGKLAARAVIGYHDEAGWIDAPNLGAHDVNDSQTRNFRLKLRAQPSDTLSVDFSAWHSKTDIGAPSLADEAGNITSLVAQPDGHTFNTYGIGLRKSLPGVEISSMTSYIDYENTGLVDGNPVRLPLTVYSQFNAKVLTEEVNLVSKLDGPWRWSAGLFYRDAEDVYYQSVDNLNPVTPDSISNDFTDTSKSVAVYGELGRRLTEHLELAAGLRYFRDRQTNQVNRQYAAPGTAPFPLNKFEATPDAVTPRVVLTWTPSAKQMVYASYAQGFRSGLVQQPNVQRAYPSFTPLEPDKLTNYEVGSKGSLGGHVSYEAAVYYLDWKDVQQNGLVRLPPPAVGLATASFNAGSASGPGASLGLTVEPLDELRLAVNLSWNDLSFDQPVFNAVGGYVVNKGDRLALSSKYTMGGSAEYGFPLGGGGLRGRAEVSANYLSPLNEGIDRGGGIFARIPSDRVFLAAARFSIEATKHWSATVYGDNLTNNDGGDSVNPATIEWTARLRPRSYGLQLQYAF